MSKFTMDVHISGTVSCNLIWLYQLLRLSKVGGLDLSRRDLDRDLDLDAQKVSVSTVEKISTVFKS